MIKKKIVITQEDGFPKIMKKKDKIIDKLKQTTLSFCSSKEMKVYTKTFTITFGDQGENHAGMQKIGSLIDNGFTVKEIKDIKKIFDERGYKTEYYCLNDLLKKEEIKDDEKVDESQRIASDEAGIVVVRNGLDMLLEGLENEIENKLENSSDLFFKEQDLLQKDSKALMRGRVVNKHARYNLCFSDFSQEADFEKGKGTVVDFKDVKLLNKVRENIRKYFGEKCKNIIAEGNYYYDPSKCGIGYHGDSERKIVIGVRVGKEMPLCFRWYYRSEIVSDRLKIILGHGDVYFSSEKAVGFDWKKSSKYTLRHAAGCDKYIK